VLIYCYFVVSFKLRWWTGLWSRRFVCVLYFAMAK